MQLVCHQRLCCDFSLHCLTTLLTIISPFCSPSFSSGQLPHTTVSTPIYLVALQFPSHLLLFLTICSVLEIHFQILVMHNSEENSNVDICVCDSPHYRCRSQKESGTQFLSERSLESNESYGSFKKILPPCILFSKQRKNLSE